MKTKLFVTLVILLFLATTAQAGLFDFLQYKVVQLEKREIVLVERFTEKVKFFWNRSANEWISTSLNPELERTFQFLYEQTKAPRVKKREEPD
jgi:hypothetical protein